MFYSFGRIKQKRRSGNSTAYNRAKLKKVKQPSAQRLRRTNSSATSELNRFETEVQHQSEFEQQGIVVWNFRLLVWRRWLIFTKIWYAIGMVLAEWPYAIGRGLKSAVENRWILEQQIGNIKAVFGWRLDKKWVNSSELAVSWWEKIQNILLLKLEKGLKN